jgi:hypothetical protein
MSRGFREFEIEHPNFSWVVPWKAWEKLSSFSGLRITHTKVDGHWLRDERWYVPAPEQPRS